MRRAAVFGVEVGLHHPFAQRFEHRNLEHIALTCATALDERRQHTGIRVHSRGDVGDRDAHATRYFGRARDAHQTGFTLHEQVVRLLLFVFAAAAVARD